MAGIDNILSGHTMTTNRSTTTRTESEASGSGSAAAESKGIKDSVSLSQQGKAIGQLHQEMASQPSVNNAKIAAIKEAIANGSYHVDPEKLADSIIKFESELGGL